MRHCKYYHPQMLLAIIWVIKARRMRWAGHVAHMGDSRSAYRVLVRRTEGRRPLGRPRRRWEDNIRMCLQKLGWGIVLAPNRDRWRALVYEVINLRVPWNAGNFLTSWRPVNFSGRTLLQGVKVVGQVTPFTETIETVHHLVKRILTRKSWTRACPGIETSSLQQAHLKKEAVPASETLVGFQT